MGDVFYNKYLEIFHEKLQKRKNDIKRSANGITKLLEKHITDSCIRTTFTDNHLN